MSSPTRLNPSELTKLGTGKTPAPVEAINVAYARRPHERMEEGSKYGGQRDGVSQGIVRTLD